MTETTADTSPHTSPDTAPVALITGAGSGIGRAVAQMLAGRGYRVGLAGRTVETLRATGELLDGGEDQTWTPIPTDIGVADQAEAMVDTCIARLGRLDALVNNAGWTELTPLIDCDAERVRKLFEINAMGPVWTTVRALKHMTQHGGGVIVNVSTLGTRDPFKGLGVYGSAKASCETLACAIANEHSEDNIRAYCVGPGAVETPMLRGLFDETALPGRMTLAPDDIATIITACITGETTMQNGETTHVARKVG